MVNLGKILFNDGPRTSTGLNLMTWPFQLTKKWVNDLEPFTHIQAESLISQTKSSINNIQQARWTQNEALQPDVFASILLSPNKISQ